MGIPGSSAIWETDNARRTLEEVKPVMFKKTKNERRCATRIAIGVPDNEGAVKKRHAKSICTRVASAYEALDKANWLQGGIFRAAHVYIA